ncbi:VanZ family protein [Nocardioides glacieisoli]|uniref:VanZ family protein n=1 Tax=Nocardioides glacieisoli TaxID=1168730 RepID=A0A4Q2RUL5_9ACTN|nr:VanZ family protein [Nocardioides glacieisoli]
MEVDPSSRGRVEGGHRDEGGDGVVARDLVVRREVGDGDGGERRTVGQRASPLAAQPGGVVPGGRDPDGHAEHLHHDLGRRPLAAHGRHSRVADVGRVGRWYVVALLATYVAGLVVLVTRPWGWELNRLTVTLWVFFRSDVPIAPDRLGPEDYGVLLNVLLFVPFGVLLTLAMRRPWWWATTAAALVASTLIEQAQWRWLERDGSWTDVAANTLGALIGAVAVSLSSRDRARPAPRPERARHP